MQILSLGNTDLPTIRKHLDYTPVDNDTESNETSMLPLAFVLLAILLGGAGLYLGLTARQQLVPLTKFVDETSSSAAYINKQLSEIDTRINELSVQSAKLKETIQRLGRESSQTLREAKQAYAGVQSNRGELIELAQNISQLATSGAAPTAPRSSLPATGTSSETSATDTFTSSSPASTYKIQPGDTFGKIASQKGVKLDALLNANPDADPRRLRIGKEINIPAN